MILALLKQVVKRMLHDATEEWLIEVGVPRAAVEDLRRQRMVTSAAVAVQADAQAAAALGVANDDVASPAALPMATAARTTTDDGSHGSGHDSGARRRSRRGCSK